MFIKSYNSDVKFKIHPQYYFIVPAPSVISYTYFYSLNIHSSPVDGVYCVFLELLVKTHLVPLIFLIILMFYSLFNSLHVYKFSWIYGPVAQV